MAITAIWTGISSAVQIHVTLAILHYIMERAWLKVQWGKKTTIFLEKNDG